MKNKLQPTRTRFSRNFQCKKAPRWLSKFFSFWYWKSGEPLKKITLYNIYNIICNIIWYKIPQWGVFGHQAALTRSPPPYYQLAARQVWYKYMECRIIVRATSFNLFKPHLRPHIIIGLLDLIQSSNICLPCYQCIMWMQESRINPQNSMKGVV